MNPPFEERFTEPLPLSVTFVAVKASPSASESLAMTPGAATERDPPIDMEYESLVAVGAAFVTVIVTVAGSVRRMPRFRMRAS